MSTTAFDFDMTIHALAQARKDELAAKDARIAELAAEHAAMADQLDRIWGRCERLTNTKDSLKTQVAALEARIAALDALVSERAVAAEQQAYDDLSGSVLAEEAYAAAAAAQAEPVIDLSGDSEGAPAPAAAAPAPVAASKPKRLHSQGTLAWMAYVKHIKVTQPEMLEGIAKESEKLDIIKMVRAEDPQGYVAFVAAWKEEHKDEATAPVAAAAPEAAPEAMAEAALDLSGDSEGEAPAAEGGAARARGGRTKVGMMPEGLSIEDQLKWAYDAYSTGLWKKSYCTRVMPKECQGYTAQSKWCLETLYPVFLRNKEKKAKESAERYAARRANVGGAMNA